ncbi:MAG TPA: proline racemase family protein [Terracidiphilus sp.]|nr:proline racemase family protein [Terracidiphilus sp.]
MYTLQDTILDGQAAMNQAMQISVIDSHTAGEPTRCVVSGGPDFGDGSLADRLEQFRKNHDDLRRAILCEPRGSDVVVGAWILPSTLPDCAAAVIYFNNAGYLGMCGHGTIGIAATLAHLGRIAPGLHSIETPVGVVRVALHSANLATIENVPAYRHTKAAGVEVPGFGTVTGDVAWGGNWFFLVAEHGFDLALRNVEQLTAFTWAIRQQLDAAGIRGAHGAEIDHVELFGPPHDRANHSRNFVLCPGKAYDRSPCGTGTSAKMACLVADGKLAPGEPWRQEGILGTVFEGSVRIEGSRVIPSITGSAFVTAESTLLFDSHDPFRLGIGTSS